MSNYVAKALECFCNGIPLMAILLLIFGVIVYVPLYTTLMALALVLATIAVGYVFQKFASRRWKH